MNDFVFHIAKCTMWFEELLQTHVIDSLFFWTKCRTFRRLFCFSGLGIQIQGAICGMQPESDVRGLQLVFNVAET